MLQVLHVLLGEGGAGRVQGRPLLLGRGLGERLVTGGGREWVVVGVGEGVWLRRSGGEGVLGEGLVIGEREVLLVKRLLRLLSGLLGISLRVPNFAGVVLHTKAFEVPLGSPSHPSLPTSSSAHSNRASLVALLVDDRVDQLVALHAEFHGFVLSARNAGEGCGFVSAAITLLLDLRKGGH